MTQKDAHKILVSKGYTYNKILKEYTHVKSFEVIEKQNVIHEATCKTIADAIFKHGGPRPGAGRPKKEPTVTLSYRVPEKKAALIDKSIRVIISKLKE